MKFTDRIYATLREATEVIADFGRDLIMFSGMNSSDVYLGRMPLHSPRTKLSALENL
jgi:hypothetical protein